MKSSLKNMVLVLFVITLVSATAVGLVNQFTSEPIQKAKDNKISQAIAEVSPAFDNDPSADKRVESIDGGEITIYTLKKSGGVVGYAVETFSKKGFGGEIKLLVGFTPDGTINNTAVISHSETPGLGDKIDKKKSDFPLQFKGKNPASFSLKVKKDGGEVDAITASTISSRAFSDALARAYTVVMQAAGKN